ncbi:DUF4157 domain-containing protein [Sorangium sp. So ce1036]|uniref:eCIS core domain-containing protein n=1 Tax=Sorangium sp. So ce1036 TaxID=3133328 RepID=UPI003F103FB6
MPDDVVARWPRSEGEPLPAAIRSRMEALFGEDFAEVRVHVGPEAASLGAAAFACCEDIFFAPGEYAPMTVRGHRILAHELAHVVQQRAGRVRGVRGAGLVMVNDETLEIEADRMARLAGLPTAAFDRAPRARPAGSTAPRRRPWPPQGACQPLTQAQAAKIDALGQELCIRLGNSATDLSGAGYGLADFGNADDNALQTWLLGAGNAPPGVEKDWDAKLLATVEFMLSMPGAVGKVLLLLAGRRPTENADTYNNKRTFKKVNSVSNLDIIATHTIASADTAMSLAEWVVQEIDNKA